MADNSRDFEANGGHVAIGTPGRIMDLHNRCKYFNLKTLEVLILDEADTLLDMGFKDTINQILSILPKQRRTGLFSGIFIFNNIDIFNCNDIFEYSDVGIFTFYNIDIFTYNIHLFL